MLLIKNRKNKISLSILILLCLVGVAFVVLGKHSHADTLQGFNAGRIIDDAVFTDTTTMDTAKIQTFLNSKLQTCDTNGTQPSEYGGGTRAQWAANASLHPIMGAFYPPFTCLKDYSEGGLSTAQIIFNLSQQYKINPQVLIVLLQKEQSLVTDTWPGPVQYRSATGYGCPDTAACDSQYYGLTNQLTWSAKMFRSILNNSPGWYTPYLLGNNYIQYSPDLSCGGSIVNIQNRSTQALYNYTPYQPNTSVVSAPMGSTVNCGAYGNMHFYQYFTQWFGTTYSPDYAWRVVSQEAYNNAAMTTSTNTDALSVGGVYYLRIKALNTGNTTWTNATGANPIYLGTAAPFNRISEFCDTSWASCNRAISLVESSVAPGSIGTFTFRVTAPTVGSYKEYFNLVADGKSWFNDIGLYWSLNVIAPTPLWQPATQALYTDAAHTMPANFNDLSPNTTYYASIKAQNIGNTTWNNSGKTPVNLATSSPEDRSSSFYDSSWISPNRTTVLKESTVTPGEYGSFDFAIRTPGTYGISKEYFRLVVEGASWMNDVGLYWPLTVSRPTPLWSVISQQTYTDTSKTTVSDMNNVKNSSRIFVSIQVRNTGNTTWNSDGTNPTRLGTSNPNDRVSEFYDNTWVSGNRPAKLKESFVPPGALGTFEFWITAPYKIDGTVLREYFTIVTEGASWMPDIGMYESFTFKTPLTTWTYAGQGSYVDPARSIPVDLSISAARSTSYYLRLKAKNASGNSWQRSNFVLGTSGPNDRISSFYNTGWITNNRSAQLNEQSVAPGSIGTFDFDIKTPNSAITSKEYFTPLAEGQYWLTDLGVYWNIIVK